jgi:hypothetical protein
MNVGISNLLCKVRLHIPTLRRSAWSIGIGAILLIVLLLVYRYWLYLKSPEYIRDQALHALMIGDAQKLYELGCPEERKLLNITPQAVHDILSHSLWLHGFPQNPRCRPFGPNPKGVAQWIVHWERPKLKNGQDMDLLVMENPDGSWGLDVSWVLCVSCNLSGKS